MLLLAYNAVSYHRPSLQLHSGQEVGYLLRVLANVQNQWDQNPR